MRRDALIIQMDKAARKGFANGTFEELAEDGSAVVEEFYPMQGADEVQHVNGKEPPASLQGRLAEKMAGLK